MHGVCCINIDPYSIVDKGGFSHGQDPGMTPCCSLLLLGGARLQGANRTSGGGCDNNIDLHTADALHKLDSNSFSFVVVVLITA